MSLTESEKIKESLTNAGTYIGQKNFDEMVRVIKENMRLPNLIQNQIFLAEDLAFYKAHGKKIPEAFLLAFIANNFLLSQAYKKHNETTYK